MAGSQGVDRGGCVECLVREGVGGEDEPAFLGEAGGGGAFTAGDAASEGDAWGRGAHGGV